MNVIIEPISEQAWARIEARVMDGLSQDNRQVSTALGARPFGFCQLARLLRSAQHRWFERRGPDTTIDRAPESGVQRRAERPREPWALLSR